MSVARAVLHVAAGFGALVAALSFLFFLHFDVDGRGIGPILVAAIVASQVGALAGWPLIDRSLDAGRRPAPGGNGLVMASVVHLSLGPLWLCVVLVVALVAGGGKAPSDMGDLVDGALFISLYSVIVVGWITAPAAMLVAHVVGRLRRDERAAGNAA